MSKLNEADLRKLLHQHPEPEVPEDLLARIQAEIPEHLEAPPLDSGTTPPSTGGSWLPLRLIAAMLIAVLGAGWLYLQLGSDLASDQALDRASRPAAEQIPARAPATGSTEKPSPSAEQSPTAIASDLLEIEIQKKQLSPAPTPEPAPVPTIAAAAPPAEANIDPPAAREAAEADSQPTNHGARAPVPTAALPAPQPEDEARQEKSASELERLEEKVQVLAVPAVPPHQQAPVVTESARERRQPSADRQDRALRKRSLDSTAGRQAADLAVQRRLVSSEPSTKSLAASPESYLVIRTYLEAGRLPPPSEVQVEALLAYFDPTEYGEPATSAATPALQIESAPASKSDGERYHLLRVSIGSPRIVEARVQVEFNPAVVASHRRVGAETNDTVDGTFRDFSTGFTDLWRIELRDPPDLDDRVATVRTRWRDDTEGEVEEIEQEFAARDLTRDWGQASESMRLANLVVEFSELLLGAADDESRGFAEVAELAEELARPTGNPQAAELARLCRLAQAVGAPKRTSPGGS